MPGMGCDTKLTSQVFFLITFRKYLQVIVINNFYPPHDPADIKSRMQTIIFM